MKESSGGANWAVWTLLMAGVLLAAMAFDSHIAMFINIPSALLVALGFGLAFGSHGVQRTIAAFKDAYVGAAAGDGESGESLAILQHLRRCFYAVSGIAILIGLVQMLANLDDPARIGPAVAVALLSPLYGLFMAEVIVGTLAERLRA